MSDDRKRPWTDNLPFPRHWKAYVALKIAVIVAAVLLAFYFLWLRA
ncbi:MAG: hypothetical protein ACJ8AS_13130 [Hyphomicrobiales bacterium]